MSDSGANGLIHAGTPQFITKTVANSLNEKNTINITITINPPSQSSGLQYKSKADFESFASFLTYSVY